MNTQNICVFVHKHFTLNMIDKYTKIVFPNSYNFSCSTFWVISSIVQSIITNIFLINALNSVMFKFMGNVIRCLICNYSQSNKRVEKVSKFRNSSPKTTITLKEAYFASKLAPKCQST